MTQNSVMTETLSYKNQSMDWFLHDRDLRYEGVKLPVSLKFLVFSSLGQNDLYL